MAVRWCFLGGNGGGARVALLLLVLLGLGATCAAASPGKVEVKDLRVQVLDGGEPQSDDTVKFGTTKQVSLSATHLQALKVEFALAGPQGADGSEFRPQQLLIKLAHESGVEHLYVPKAGPDGYSLQLDFLRRLSDLYYLSGLYSLDLIVGDVGVDNSFIWRIGELELDLPAAPEGAKKPPASRRGRALAALGPRPEISHVFRLPEKRPPLAVSYAFTLLALLPLAGFVAGLAALKLNVQLFPSAGTPQAAAVAFHAGIAAILVLYFVFWLKLGLFSTLRWLTIIGIATAVPGFLTLSHLADMSTKQKAQ